MVNPKVSTCFFLSFLMISFFIQSCSAIDQSVADEALVNAENVLASAYVAVAESENAGANISELLMRLGVAGSLLAEANNSYRVGNYDRAYLYAINCSDTVSGIVVEALILKSEAEELYNRNLFLAGAFSSFSLSVLLVLSLFGWRFLKNRYLKRVLGMKPEVRKS